MYLYSKACIEKLICHIIYAIIFTVEFIRVESSEHLKSQKEHQKLKNFVNRLDLDISKEAEYLQLNLIRAQSLTPQIGAVGNKAKLHVKNKEGKDVVHEIPILTGKDRNL